MKVATISGRLGHSPKLRTLPSGEPVLNLSVAVDDSKKVDGQWVKETLWIDVTMFGRRTTALESMLQQGTVIVAHGTLGMRTYTARDGLEKSRLEIVASDIQPVNNLRPREEQGTRSNAQGRGATQHRRQGSSEAFDDADDIPF